MIATLTAIAAVMTAIAAPFTVFYLAKGLDVQRLILQRQQWIDAPHFCLFDGPITVEKDYIYVAIQIYPGNYPVAIRNLTCDACAIAQTSRIEEITHISPSFPEAFSSTLSLSLDLPPSRFAHGPENVELLIKPRKSQSVVNISFHSASTFLPIKHKITMDISNAIL